jgi:hypothetical protein
MASRPLLSREYVCVASAQQPPFALDGGIPSCTPFQYPWRQDALEGGELLTGVFRAVLGRDLETSGVFVITNGERGEAPARRDSSMRLCVSV